MYRRYVNLIEDLSGFNLYKRAEGKNNLVMNPKKVRIYTVKWCPHCTQLRSFLAEEKIQHQELDVESDDLIWKEALSMTGGQDIVPVVNVDGQVEFGAFTEEFKAKLRKLLGLRDR
ncbi:glutaredoxin family protein [bacterium]|nr:glutaredoxin family protein [bacterium]